MIIHVYFTIKIPIESESVEMLAKYQQNKTFQNIKPFMCCSTDNGKLSLRKFTVDLSFSLRFLNSIPSGSEKRIGRANSLNESKHVYIEW